MKKLYIVVLALTLLAITSCSSKQFEINDKIRAPEIESVPIEGKWTIEKFLDSPFSKGDSDSNDLYLGKEALFHKEAIVVGEEYIINPHFKLKNINLSDYLLYKYKTGIKDLDLEVDEAQVLTIYEDNQYLHEFVRYDENHMFTFIDGKFYFLTKNVEEVSKEEVDRYINIENNIMRISNTDNLDTLRSGILLGIKSYEYDESIGRDKWKYKTLWIRFNNYQMASAYEIENLLVPRKKGFWLVNVDKEGNRDKIYSKQVREFKEEIMEEELLISPRSFIKDEDLAISKEILYIGNDYVSTQVENIANKRQELELYPIDYLSEEKAVKISDLIGDEGLRAFKDGSKNLLKADSNILLDESNFGLGRRNGYWIMKGRLNYQSGEEELFMDFNIKTIPPKEVVNYNELLIPWNKIKSRVPEAIDAFTSPNEDAIIIVTRNSLLIYAIADNDISQKELGKIKITNSDSIIMAEWGLGRYALLWEEEVLKNEPLVKLEY